MSGGLLSTVLVLLLAAAVEEAHGACPLGWTTLPHGTCVFGIPLAPPGPPTQVRAATVLPAMHASVETKRRLGYGPCLVGWDEHGGSCNVVLQTPVPLGDVPAATLLRARFGCGRPDVTPAVALEPPAAGTEPDATASDAFPGSWPWMASLQVSFTDGPRWDCSGTLLSREWVLTAADCISDGDDVHRRIQVRLGAHDLREVLPTEQRRDVVDVVLHPKHSPSSKDYNLALLKLDAPVEFTSLTMPACLPWRTFRLSSPSTLYSPSWRRAETPTGAAEPGALQQTSADTLHPSACSKLEGYITTSICTNRSTAAPWQAASGDPLFYFNRRKNFVLMGVTGETAQCDSDDSCFFRSIVPHVGWILGTVGTLPTMEECGRPAVQPKHAPPMRTVAVVANAEKIFHGTSTLPTSWPWQVSVFVPRENGETWLCGGSLIDEQWVVSAAQCFYTPPLMLRQVQIRLGAHNLYGEAPGEQRRYPVQMIMRSFDPSQEAFGDDDIILIRLNSPVAFSASVRPICLPGEGDDVLVGGDKVFATGWGSTETDEYGGYQALRQVDMSIVDFDQCRSKYGDSVTTENMICAGDWMGESSVCTGDTGGPLVQRTDDGTFYLVGVVSWSQGCAPDGYPDVFTRVSRYRDWIRSMTGV